jgi:uncharacterized protein (UPF0276 family)
VDRIPRLGLGCAWRGQLADALARRTSIEFIELHAENWFAAETPAANDPLPESIEQLKMRGAIVVPHSVTLDLGGAAGPDPRRLDMLAELAERVGAPLVSDHVCFVRGGGLEAGHLLPLPRTRESLAILVENIAEAKDRLPVPLAIENIASVFQWPENEMDEATFIAEALERTDSLLLLDLANVVCNEKNHGWDPIAFLDKLPLERLAYIHMAGGFVQDGIAIDSHSDPVWKRALDLLEEVSARIEPNGAMLERDDNYAAFGEADLNRELDGIAAAMARGAARRRAGSSVRLEGSHDGHVLLPRAR